MSYDFGHLYLQLMSVSDSDPYRRAVLNPSISPSLRVFAVTLGGSGGLFGKCKITEINNSTAMLHSKRIKLKKVKYDFFIIPKPLALFKVVLRE